MCVCAGNGRTGLHWQAGHGNVVGLVPGMGSVSVDRGEQRSCRAVAAGWGVVRWGGGNGPS